MGRATVSDVVGSLGRSFQKAGHGMQDHYSKPKGNSNWFTEQQNQRELEEEQQRLDNLVNRNDTDQHEEGQG